ncbi:MAG: polyprenyl synthetase family protein [Candidatus Micrarchaeia archaeon]
MAHEGVMEYIEAIKPKVEAEIERIMPRNKEPQAVYKIIWDLLDRGGKRFRPALCMLSCEAVGGDPDSVLPAAVSIELFHNFTLIHDDIEDDSKMRRGKPCLHHIYGVPLAINAGDGLFMWVFQSLFNLKFEPEKIIETEKRLCNAFSLVLDGQGIELEWHKNKTWDITEENYFSMVEGKTGALLGAACSVGAYLGGGSEEEIKRLEEFGKKLGIAFQIRDDVLNLIGEEDLYKKEIGGDIREGKRTLSTIYALRNCEQKDREKLLVVLGKEASSDEEIQEVIDILRNCGAVDYAKRKCRKISGEAKMCIEQLPDSRTKRMLLELADFLVMREF